MKKYPKKQPNSLTMLLDYTIFEDIKLYEARYQPGHEFTNNFKRTPYFLTRINTLLSFAIEAELVLKNIYVKTDDVVEKLKSDGHFEAPGIFFVFYSYTYFKIRQKTHCCWKSSRSYRQKAGTYLIVWSLL